MMNPNPLHASTVIVTDEGHFKCFTVDHETNQARLVLQNETQLREAHEPIGEKVTDQAGRYRNSVSGTSTFSEPNGLEMETQRRLREQIAQLIESNVSMESPLGWVLAAPAELARDLVERMSPVLKRRLTHTVTKDLTGIPHAQLMGHLLPG